MGSNNDDGGGGFLKLSKTHEWVSGDNTAPINKKATAKALRNGSERRKKLNLLEYEAVGYFFELSMFIAQKGMMLLSVGIGTACSGYCLIALSVQAAISYAVGVLFSCLYLQLLCQHADNLSKEMVPQTFMLKKSKKYEQNSCSINSAIRLLSLQLSNFIPLIAQTDILNLRIGIRSEDLENFLQRTIKGSSLALSSPRLVIPATIYGSWALSHQYFANEFFDFQLVPATVGMFVHKAAALVQVYRDNEDMQFIFPENEGGSSD